jgi:HSP20 family protein
MTTRIIRRTVNPWSAEALSLREVMNQLVENAFVAPNHWYADWTPLAAGTPAIDVLENNDAYVVKAALPGWKPENVDITFENGTLTLKGEVNGESERNDESTRWHRHEIRRASFTRTVGLPTEVEPDKANAEFENGVLTLTLPKAEVVKPKQIKITAK